MSDKKKIVVVDDHAMFRKGLCMLVNLFSQYEILFDAEHGKDLIAKINEDHLPDIVLLDINMPEVDGAILFELIRAFHKNVKVIVSSVYHIDEQKEKIKDADGYFDKSDGKDVLISLVSSLLADPVLSNM